MSRPNRGDIRIRLSLDMTRETRELLTNLRIDTNADSLTEVIRRALVVYKFFVDRTSEGGTTVVQFKDGSTQRVEFL